MWPLVAQLVDDRHDQFAGRGEADADRAARGRDDGGADPYHLAIHVEDRAARVAWIDRRIELQEVVERTRAKIAATRRDDAGGDRPAEAERIAGGQHPVAHLDLAGIAERDGGQRAGRLTP